MRAGHAGTLDPFATGLLILLLGRATRLQRYVLGLPKTYVATARLGWRSSTGDPEGDLVHTGRIPERLELPTGRISQTPPMTSAIKVGGERLYRAARRGEEVERAAREIEVTRAELLASDEESATFEIDCSSGTYVRTLVEELGDAYCEALRRTAIGPHRIEEAAPEPRPVEELLPFLPEPRAERRGGPARPQRNPPAGSRGGRSGGRAGSPVERRIADRGRPRARGGAAHRCGARLSSG